MKLLRYNVDLQSDSFTLLLNGLATNPVGDAITTEFAVSGSILIDLNNDLSLNNLIAFANGKSKGKGVTAAAKV